MTLEDVLMRRLAIFYQDVNQGLGVAEKVAQHMAKLLHEDDNWVKTQVANYRRTVERSRSWKTEDVEKRKSTATA